MALSTFAWESDMKPAAIGLLLGISAVTISAGPTAADQLGSGVIVIGSDQNRHSTLGAPLYAGANVIIVGGGRTYYGKPRGYGRRGLGSNRYRPGRGLGYSFGYTYRGPRSGYPRYGYNPYQGNPYSYGNRYPYPRYGYAPPRQGPYYYGDRGGGRGYGRERYDRSPRLTILGATYRSIDGRACDAFSFVHRRCDGERSCSVRANNNICGDPDRGRLKVLEVVYACGDRQLRANVPERSRSKLRCR